MKRKTVLVTGGAGFLGLHLTHYFRKNYKNFNVVLLDLNEIDKKEYLENTIFIKGDIRDKKLINKLFRQFRFDYVIHAAAALPLWKKKEIFDININGTRNLLKNSLKTKVNHFIFISSTAVYGIPKKHPILENDQLIGVGPYGKSKIKAEEICQHYRKKGLTITILRPKTFVGEYRLGVFEILFDWIHDGKMIPIIGSGNNRYQLLDVNDLVEAIFKIMTFKNKNKVNDVFNVGAEQFGTVKEDLDQLFSYAAEKSGKKKSTILPTPAFLVKKILWFFEKLKLSPLYQWVYETADQDSFVSIDKIKKTINWRPKYSNAEALIKAYQWYLDNYKEIKVQNAGITHRVGWNQGILGLIKKFF